MKQSSSEKLITVIKYTIISAVSLGLICAIVIGLAFRFDEAMGGIVSLGATQEALQYAFIEGAKKGGLYGGFTGGFLGILFGSSVVLFRKTVK